jgi:hypothetical protein
VPDGFDQLPIPPDTYLPRHIELPATHPPDVNTGFTGFTGGGNYGLCRYCVNQNDEIAWDLVFLKGTWELVVAHWRNNDEGIFEVFLDSTSLGTKDCYSAGSSQFEQTTFAVPIGSTGIKRVKIKCINKNASSSGFVIALNSISLRRTG